MAYYVGDIPAEDIVIEPARQGIPIDLAPFSDGDAILRDFDGLPVVTSGFAVSIDQDLQHVIIEWPGESPFAESGLYLLIVTLHGTGVQERLATVYLVAQGDDGWYSLDEARNDWPGAPDDDYRLFTLLWVAQNDVLSYLPLAAGAPVPLNYKIAQLMQTRNIWNASTADPSTGGGDAGDDTFAIVAHPLDWAITQMLNPKTNRPVIG